MTKICVVTGAGEPPYSTNRSFVSALKELECEVVVCGPRYWDRCFADIEVPDRPHPEMYTYEEILPLLPWEPDLMLNIEPHGFLTGRKPTGIKSAFFVTDPHRAGALYQKVLLEGDFDYFFCGQRHYLDLFSGLGAKRYHLPVAFDPSRISKVKSDPEVDISFCGQTGLALKDWMFDQTDNVGRYVSKLTDKLPPGLEKYEFSRMPSFDYAERGELLWRLSQEFNVRIYEPLYDDRYGLALQKGAVGFNHSLLNDISIRNYEVMAAGRALVTNMVPQMDEVFVRRAHLYEDHYRPFYQNFDLTVSEVYNIVSEIVGSRREFWAKSTQLGSEEVWRNHRWVDRASEMLDVILS